MRAESGPRVRHPATAPAAGAGPRKDHDGPRVSPAIALLLSTALGCATAPAGGGKHELVVVDDGGAELWRGVATYTAREKERAVLVKGVGEILVGERCRFAWAKDGLDRLVLFDLDGAHCADQETARLCFSRARFVSGDGRVVVVDGCADENDLLWSKVDGAKAASIAPTLYRTRCVRLPPRARGCDVHYLVLDDITVESNDKPRDGFRFTWDGDGWRACFREKESGRYRVTLRLEDGCGARGPLLLEGRSSELDD
jgi:hypothetical protein